MTQSKIQEHTVSLLGWTETAELRVVAVARHETATRPLLPWYLSTVSSTTWSVSTDDSTSSDSLNIKQINHFNGHFPLEILQD